MSILRDITARANAAGDAESAIHYAMQRICAEDPALRLAHTIVHYPERRDPRSRMLHVWHPNDDPVFEAFKDRCESVAAASGRLPATEVHASGEAIAITDLPKVVDPEAARLAIDVGLVAAYGFPILAGDQRVGAMAFYSTQRDPSDDIVRELARDIGLQIGYVIERKALERAAADNVWLQQQRFGRELHDGVCQDLVGASILCDRLRRRLETSGSDEAEEAARIKELISETLEKVRGMSRGLSPIDMGFGGLREALQELAQNTEKRFGIPCEFQLRGPLPGWDDDDALHLYWIMHEAASNAGRHSQAERIRIEVDSTPQATVIRVTDDGIGLPPDTNPGLGTRTMRHHAGIIGAALDITGEPGHGTVVTCRLKERRSRP
ncbi:MAG: histidine kinase [Planctomycetota bacterium]|nr:histidine kinase [Planctomycetota bacterium]